MDTQRRLQVTHSLWTDQPQIVEADRMMSDPKTPGALYGPGWCELRGKNGELFAQFGLGQPLVMLPADIASQWLFGKMPARLLTPPKQDGDVGRHHRRLREFMVNLMTFSVITVLAVVLSYELLLLLGFGNPVAVAATMLLVTATSFLVYAQVSQENSLIYLCYVGALVFALRAGKGQWKRNVLAAGAFAGFGLLIRLPDVVYLVPVAALLLWLRIKAGANPGSVKGMAGRVWQEAPFLIVFFGLPVAAFLAIDRWYQFHRFGDVFGTFMKQCAEAFARVGYPAGYPFGHDVITGFLGPFIAADKSVVLFDPFIVFSLLFTLLCWRRVTAQQMLVIAGSAFAFVGLAAIYAGTYFWTGGPGDWGPRHHLVPIEVICLVGFAFAIRDFATFGVWTRLLVAANAIVAVLVQILALPLFAFTEFFQTLMGDPVRIVPLMRLRNLYHLALGSFEAAGLSYNAPVITHFTTQDAFLFLFVRVGTAAPPAIGASIIALWVVLIAAVVAMTGMAVAKAVQANAAGPARPDRGPAA